MKLDNIEIAIILVIVILAIYMMYMLGFLIGLIYSIMCISIGAFIGGRI